MSTQPSVDRAHVSLATACPPWGRRPTDSGRKPHGSRTASTRSAASRTSEKAPFHAGSVRSMRSSHVAPAGGGEHQRHHLGVARRGQPEAARQQLVAQRRRVDDVAVVGEGQRAVHRLDEERLDVALVRRPGRRVPGVADRVVAGQRLQRLVGEDVRHEPGLLVDPGPVAVADGDAGGLLAAVLQGEQPEERELGDALAVRCRDAEHATLLRRRSRCVDVADADRGTASIGAPSSQVVRRTAAMRAVDGVAPGSNGSPVSRS